MAATRKESAARHLAQMQADPGDRRHGTATGYTYGCRCERCKEANSARMKEWRRDREEARRRQAKARAERLAALNAAAEPRTVRIHGMGDVRI